MLGSGSSGVVLMKAAAGHSHVSVHIKMGRLLAPLLLNSSIKCVEGFARVHVRQSNQKGGK